MALHNHYRSTKPSQYDIWVYEDAGHWQVQRRFGGPAANSRWYQFD